MQAKSREITLFTLGILAGFLFPSLAIKIKGILLPSLIVMMTISLQKVRSLKIKTQQKKEVIGLLILNYGVLSILLLSIGKLLITYPPYYQGIQILALMPPAIGIISLSYLLHGNTTLGFFAETVGYVLAFAIVPLGSLLLFGKQVHLLSLLYLLLEIIIVPFLLSRMILWWEKKRKTALLQPATAQSIIQLCYAVSFFIAIGINKMVLLKEKETLLLLVVFLSMVKFLGGSIVYAISKKLRKKPERILMVLFSTLKNGGAGMVFALLLFGPAQTMPFAVNSIVTPFYILYLEWLLRKGLMSFLYY